MTPVADASGDIFTFVGYALQRLSYFITSHAHSSEANHLPLLPPSILCAISCAISCHPKLVLERCTNRCDIGDKLRL